MNSLIYFKGSQIRTAGTQDQPLFCARDVCELLEIKSPEWAFRRIPDSQKGMCSTHTLGGPQMLLFVTEPGLYRLVFQSRKKEAVQFQDWVFERVLPAIRRHGHFVADRDDHPPELLALPDERRERVFFWLEIFQDLLYRIRVRERILEISALNKGIRGFSPQSIYRRYRLWRASGNDWRQLTHYVVRSRK